MSTDSADVVIVGAGVHGASAAYHIAEMGMSVIVVERGAPAGGPTGMSSAVCRAYYTNPFLAEVARDALDFFSEFEERTKGAAASGYCRTGGLFLHALEERNTVEETVNQLKRIGTQADLLDSDELASMFPHIRSQGIGCGVWEENAGYADPVGTTVGLLKRAVELGADVRTQSAVHEISTKSGGGGILRTHDGREIRAPRILLTTGPWTRSLASQIGVELPLSVERHIVATFAWGEAPPIPHVLADIAQGYYQKPEGTEEYFLGPLHPAPVVDVDNYDNQIEDGEVYDLASQAIHRVPSLKESHHRGGWASLYDVSPDWQPVIGEVADGIFVDAGSSGHGFKLAPALGWHVANMVAGAETDPGLGNFSPSRFDKGQWLQGGYGDARIIG